MFYVGQPISRVAKNIIYDGHAFWSENVKIVYLSILGRIGKDQTITSTTKY